MFMRVYNEPCCGDNIVECKFKEYFIKNREREREKELFVSNNRFYIHFNHQ
jgi:hypothetical protein